MKSLIIYDFDGVLADTLDDMLRFAGQVCKQLGYACQPTQAALEALEVMDFVSYGRQLGVPEGDLERFADELRLSFLTSPMPIETFPGIPELLTGESDNRIQAIITGNARDLVVAFLRQHSLQEHIHLIFSGDMPGTRQDKIFSAIRDSGASLESTIIVSDAVSDIHEARQVGIRSIAVTWGYQSKEKLAARQPDAIADSPSELAALLERLCRLQGV